MTDQNVRCSPNAAGAVPRLWPGSTVAILGGGPSLTDEDVEACRGRVRVIAINDAYQKAPWADVLYACDAKWWRWHPEASAFSGLKYALFGCDNQFPEGSDIRILENTGVSGLEVNPAGVRNGQNSGFQAINLAVHLGVVRILLLAFDMQYGQKGESHWFGEHPDGHKPPIGNMLPWFDTLVKPLAACGVEIFNCSRRTALKAFPRLPLEDALKLAEGVAA